MMQIRVRAPCWPHPLEVEVPNTATGTDLVRSFITVLQRASEQDSSLLSPPDVLTARGGSDATRWRLISLGKFIDPSATVSTIVQNNTLVHAVLRSVEEPPVTRMEVSDDEDLQTDRRAPMRLVDPVTTTTLREFFARLQRQQTQTQQPSQPERPVVRVEEWDEVQRSESTAGESRSQPQDTVIAVPHQGRRQQAIDNAILRAQQQQENNANAAPALLTRIVPRPLRTLGIWQALRDGANVSAGVNSLLWVIAGCLFGPVVMACLIPGVPCPSQARGYLLLGALLNVVVALQGSAPVSLTISNGN